MVTFPSLSPSRFREHGWDVDIPLRVWHLPWRPAPPVLAAQASLWTTACLCQEETEGGESVEEGERRGVICFLLHWLTCSSYIKKKKERGIILTLLCIHFVFNFLVFFCINKRKGRLFCLLVCLSDGFSWQYYGEEYVSKRGPIPAHLMGNMWSQSWSEIYDLAIPYPGKTSVDVTPQMVQQVTYVLYLPCMFVKTLREGVTLSIPGWQSHAG